MIVSIFKWSVAAVFALTLISCGGQQHLKYQGYVDGDYIFMTSPYAGQLKNLYVREGDYVKQNQLLFILDPEPELSQLNAAKANLATAISTLNDFQKGQRETIITGIEAQIAEVQHNIALTQIRLYRAKTLYEKHAGNKDAYDAALAEYNSRLEQLKKLQADLAEARLPKRSDVILAQQALVKAAAEKVTELTWILQQKSISSPSIGYVYEIFFRPGEFVPAAHAVLSLLTPQNVFFVFFVPVTKISKIHVRDSVTISCEGCSKTYKATISFVSPQVEFTPPVIYSDKNNYKYVFRIRALPDIKEALTFHLGQPVNVELDH